MRLAGGQVSSNDFDFTVVGLTPTGQQRWVYRYPDPAGYYKMATSVVCGADSNIHAAGPTGPDTAMRLTVVSLTPGGGVRWVYRHDSLGTGIGCARALACGPDGSVYVAGVAQTADGGADFVVICLTKTGAERWTYRYNGTGHGDNGAYSVAYGQDNNIYAAGYSVGSNSAYDIVVVSLTPLGEKGRHTDTGHTESKGMTILWYSVLTAMSMSLVPAIPTARCMT